MATATNVPMMRAVVARPTMRAKVPAALRPKPKPPQGAPTVTASGAKFATQTAQIVSVFDMQAQRSREAAVFLQGLGADGSDRVLSPAERAAVAAKIEKITTQVRAYTNEVMANKAAFSSEDTLLLNDVERQLKAAFDSALEVGRGYYNSIPITLSTISTAMSATNKQLAEALLKYAAVVERYNKGGTAAWAGKAAAGLKTAAAGLWDIATGPMRFLKWGLIGLGVLFVAPPLIKIILAARRGGTDAALTETVRAAEAGQGVVRSGASLATRAAAAYASGGSSEIARKALPGVAGISRRKHRKARY